MESYRSKDYWTTESTLYGERENAKWSYLNSHSHCRVLFAENALTVKFLPVLRL